MSGYSITKRARIRDARFFRSKEETNCPSGHHNLLTIVAAEDVSTIRQSTGNKGRRKILTRLEFGEPVEDLSHFKWISTVTPVQHVMCCNTSCALMRAQDVPADVVLRSRDSSHL